MQQQKDKATQHNSPKAVIFQRKISCLDQVGLEPTTICFLGNALTNWANEAAQLAGLESHIQSKTKHLTKAKT